MNHILIINKFQYDIYPLDCAEITLARSIKVSLKLGVLKIIVNNDYQALKKQKFK